VAPCVNDPSRVYVADKTLEEIDHEVFRKARDRIGVRPTKLAQALGISLATVYDRLKRLGIPRPRAD
jgi:DNA-binding NtrC family response regulator